MNATDDLERLGLWAAAVINLYRLWDSRPRSEGLPRSHRRDFGLMLVLGATGNSLARLTRPQQSLLSDAYRVLTIVARSGWAGLAHTSILRS